MTENYSDVVIPKLEDEVEIEYERVDAYLGCRIRWFYFRAKHRKTGQECMIDREFLRREENTEEEASMIIERSRREVSVLRSLSSGENNDLVRQCIDVFQTNNDWIYRVYEMLPPNTYSADEVLEYNCQSLLKPANIIQSILYQLLLALDHCHSKQIVHCRIQPRSLLLIPKNTTSSADDMYNLKLTNFESARHFYEPNPYPMNQHFSCFSTLWYDAPELLLSEPQRRDVLAGPATDIWSAGTTFGEICNMNQPLFPGDCEIDTLYKIFRQCGTPTNEDWPGVTKFPNYNSYFPKWDAIPFPEKIRTQLNDEQGQHLLMKQLLSLDPNKRPTARTGVTHAYFFNKGAAAVDN